MTDSSTKPLNSENSNRNDLAWLTEQYVLGELDVASCELLEARLAEDQVAREALANAVALLSAATMATDSQPAVELAPRVVAANWRIYQGWFVGIAVAILVGAFWAAQGDWFQPSPNGSLAEAWSETREAAALEEQEVELLATIDSTTLWSEEVETPDWLVTAVALNQDQHKESKTPDGSSEMGEGA